MAKREMQDQEQHSFDGIVENNDNPQPRFFSLMFIGLIVWGVLFMAYYLFSGWSSEQEFQEKMADHQQRFAASAVPVSATAPLLPDQDRLLLGQQLYARDCAMCHGADGQGGIGSDLTSTNYTYGRQLTEVSESIGSGRPGGMPAYGQQYSPEQLENVSRFVLSLGR
jgi:cytochrome c oxidase cbb3-type subunit III